jgi:molecular chaperone DnaK
LNKKLKQLARKSALTYKAKENNITIKANGGLTDAEIDQMVKDAELNAEADKTQRELIEARNTAEGQAHSIRSDYKEVESDLNDEEKAAINQALESVDQALAGSDKEAIQKASEALFVAAAPVMQAKAKKQTPEAAPADGVVDAEFTEVKDDKA